MHGFGVAFIWSAMIFGVAIVASLMLINAGKDQVADLGGGAGHVAESPARQVTIGWSAAAGTWAPARRAGRCPGRAAVPSGAVPPGAGPLRVGTGRWSHCGARPRLGAASASCTVSAATSEPPTENSAQPIKGPAERQQRRRLSPAALIADGRDHRRRDGHARPRSRPAWSRCTARWRRRCVPAATVSNADGLGRHERVRLAEAQHQHQQHRHDGRDAAAHHERQGQQQRQRPCTARPRSAVAARPAGRGGRRPGCRP